MKAFKKKRTFRKEEILNFRLHNAKTTSGDEQLLSWFLISSN